MLATSCADATRLNDSQLGILKVGSTHHDGVLKLNSLLITFLSLVPAVTLLKSLISQLTSNGLGGTPILSPTTSLTQDSSESAQQLETHTRLPTLLDLADLIEKASGRTHSNSLVLRNETNGVGEVLSR